jgi:hypothetical protein
MIICLKMKELLVDVLRRNRLPKIYLSTAKKNYLSVFHISMAKEEFVSSGRHLSKVVA